MPEYSQKNISADLPSLRGPRRASHPLPEGVWPVMLTPFRSGGGLDWKAADALVDWYVARGAAGIFTSCLSSEMYRLTSGERLRLAARTARRSAGRVPVAAAGAFGETLSRQADMVKRFADTGVAAVVLTVNQLASEHDTEARWQRRAEALFRLCPDIPLGLYECPEPYPRTLSPKLLRWAAETHRVIFYKDTCCSLRAIRAKLHAAAGTPLAWFNAHAPTLLESLRAGGQGYCGIAANCYPELFAWLCAQFRRHPGACRRLQGFLTLADMSVRHGYPASAKRFLALLGLPIGPSCRVPSAAASPGDDAALILANLRAAVRAAAEKLPAAADLRRPRSRPAGCRRNPGRARNPKAPIIPPR